MGYWELPLTTPAGERAILPRGRSLELDRSPGGSFLSSGNQTTGARQVSVYPCSVCGVRRPGKLASAYWAWFKADGSRSAWKMRYCPADAVDNLQQLLSNLRDMGENEEVFACVSCGASAAEDSDPIYLTLYLPGKEPMEYALQLDSACAAKLRIPITERGTKLEDRGGVVRGPSPSTSAWDALGLSPA